MKQRLKFYIAILFCIPASMASSQCNIEFDSLRLEINPDFFYDEVSWVITDYESNFVYAIGQPTDSSAQTFYYCVAKTGCFKFQIRDSQGDGIYPDGSYSVYLRDSLIFTGNARFGAEESFVFGCPPGIYCSSAIPIDTGSFVASHLDKESWYAFTPDVSGLYQFESCSDSNACASKIWIYDGCLNLMLSEGITGALFYGENGCTQGVEFTSALQANKPYYIRLRYTDTFCDGTPLHFGVHFAGSIVGCLDSLACNFNPLATVAGTCLYAGNPNCPPGPDLAIDQDYLRQSLSLNTISNADACAVNEGCVRGTGTRHLINFATRIKNIGVTDYFVGATPANPTTPSNQFFWDQCHNHWHYRGYAEYLLYDENGLKIPIGTKNGFCVLDLACQGNSVNKYTCINMGITAGCEDLYDVNTPCQWIDITGLPSGKYNLVNRVNWDRSPDALGRFEFSYANNWALACFELTYTGSTPNVEFLTDCAAFIDCSGDVYGDAQPDCEGVCAGPALVGDWNKDTIRNSSDVEIYLNQALLTALNTQPCQELTGDNGIDVYDAAVLQECVLYGQNPMHWGLRTPCLLPTQFINTSDEVNMRIGKIDTIEKFVEIEMFNPVMPQIGFQFSVTGLVIDTLENLALNYHPQLRFNPNNGQILGLSADSSAISKSVIPQPFLRIRYSALTNPTICLDTIQSVVNARYQKGKASLSIPSCVQPGMVSVSSQPEARYQAMASPNPCRDYVKIYVQNMENEPLDIIIRDISGVVYKQFYQALQDQLSIDTQSLAPGVYFYEISGRRGVQVGKFIVL